MPAEIITSQMETATGREIIFIMDDFGTEFQLYVSVKDAANRQGHIDAALLQQSANEKNIEDYAAQHGIDISAERVAGKQKKDAAKSRAQRG